MPLLSFIARRLGYSILVLLGLSIVIFVIARIMPGDPARMAVGMMAPQWVVDRLREQMHLNQSLPVQYVFWLRDALHGDFGLSLVTQRPVMSDIVEFFPASLELVLCRGPPGRSRGDRPGGALRAPQGYLDRQRCACLLLHGSGHSLLRVCHSLRASVRLGPSRCFPSSAG